MKSLWIRAETLSNERRVALTPNDAQYLIEQGHQIYVERSPIRIFSDNDYRAMGCELVEAGSYIRAAKSDYVLGIKALDRDEEAISQQHIYFAHAYKGQEGADQLLRRFGQGGGRIFDLEFLCDPQNRRACYFGYWSGMAAASLTLLQWCNNQSSHGSPIPNHFDQLAIAYDSIEKSLASYDHRPNAIVIGYKGNCGRGVKSILEHFNIEMTLWDKEHTSNSHAFNEILEHDLFFNCIYLSEKIPPFITEDDLHQSKNRQLSLVCDIACDPDNPLNPIPIYRQTTSFDVPAQRLVFQQQPLDIIAISNLPSFYPRESSEAFSAQLCPYLEQLLTQAQLPPAWQALEQLFEQQLSLSYARAG